ncbi:MAG TPA: 23S rRNA (pseudouridine(1915)-N(3))-methyltransferase RlmH [Longimicrobiales bacterium]|nr:23S rRNA (pseudouridine(1915)-N(3))-methyltransferase RlmH [Longimicrobiales bacterium]
MRLWVGAVGRPGTVFGGAIAEYERRAGRYWGLDVVEVRETKAHKGLPVAEVRAAESRRLLERVPAGYEIVATTREGETWSSSTLAKYLEQIAVRGGAGVAFLIGGAYGLDEAALRRARHLLSLSSFTLPHELARLVLAEQLYRAGTIVRGEPYHKAAE